MNPKFNTEDTTKPIQRDTGSMNTILNVNESMGNIQLQKRDLNEIPVFDLEKEPDSPEIQVKKLTRKKSTIAEIRRQKTLFKMGSEDLGSTQAILESQAKIENEDT